MGKIHFPEHDYEGMVFNLGVSTFSSVYFNLSLQESNIGNEIAAGLSSVFHERLTGVSGGALGGWNMFSKDTKRTLEPATRWGHCCAPRLL